MSTSPPHSPHPAAAGLDYFAEIAAHSAGLAAAAESDLTAPVEHCPGWTMADLVGHLWQVHWFWALVAEQRLTAPPDAQPPARPADDVLLAEFRAGALRLIEVLRAADPETPVWTWAPAQHNIGFITRHQVQEAAVHRWDAEHAAGHRYQLDPRVSVDSIEEFLTFSVASPADPPAEPQAGLAGGFVLAATDADASWTVRDAEPAGTVRFERGGTPGLPSINGSASDLLLWLYQRVELEPTGLDPSAATDLVRRFRLLSFTD